ncbi:translation elongation factor Ts [Rickettsiaceae bacterium]|nr:translation elongation factor Ts [Rickettsiaceae bacterium]
MTVTASLVKDLRAKTGAGMMDCKKALVEVNGDFESAIDWLRTKGLAAAAKKAGRVASEGLTAVHIDGNKAAVVEINSETDFVAKNETFQQMVQEVAEIATSCNDLAELKGRKVKSGKSVDEEIVANVATIGENLNLRRMQSLSITDGVIVPYVHNAIKDNMGRISVLVALESKADKEKLSELGKQIAMHIAATRPECLNKESVDPALVQREKDIFTEQSRASGKPDNIIEKMIEGRIRKFLEEIVLLDQTFVIDGKSKISEVVANFAKEAGTDITLKAYARLEIGEGIEKEESNFADEVAAAAKS